MFRALYLVLAAGVLSACTLFGSPGVSTPPAATSPATPPATVEVTRSPPPTTAAAQPTPAPRATAEPTAPAVAPAYERADCRFEVPPGANVECGFLTVPERRDRPNGRSIRLHVAIYRSHAATPAPDPVVYLEGGPGGDALKSVSLGFARRIFPFLQERDFIVFDQRGTGFSE